MFNGYLHSKYNITGHLEIAADRCRNTIRSATRISDGKECVIKSISDKEAGYRELDHVSLLQQKGVKNIMEIIDHKIDYNNINIIMPHYGEDWFETYINCIEYHSLQKVREIIYPLFKTVDNIHQKGFFHLDLKPENICYTDYTRSDFVLIDFETSSPSHITSVNHIVGTKNYVAPEAYDGHVSELSDSFSLGIIMHVLKTKSEPNTFTVWDTDQKQLESFNDLYLSLTDKNYENRITVEKALSHDFFSTRASKK